MSFEHSQFSPGFLFQERFIVLKVDFFSTSHYFFEWEFSHLALIWATKGISILLHNADAYISCIRLVIGTFSTFPLHTYNNQIIHSCFMKLKCLSYSSFVLTGIFVIIMTTKASQSTFMFSLLRTFLPIMSVKLLRMRMKYEKCHIWKWTVPIHVFFRQVNESKKFFIKS